MQKHVCKSCPHFFYSFTLFYRFLSFYSHTYPSLTLSCFFICTNTTGIHSSIHWLLTAVPSVIFYKFSCDSIRENRQTSPLWKIGWLCLLENFSVWNVSKLDISLMFKWVEMTKYLPFLHTSAALDTLYSTLLHGFCLTGTPKTDWSSDLDWEELFLEHISAHGGNCLRLSFLSPTLRRI